MLKKRLVISFCLIIISILLTGCWNRVEPKDLALITSILYDKKDSNVYDVTIEFLNPAQNTGSKESNSSKTIILKGEGNSAVEALRNVSTSINKLSYFAHNRARLISERLAKDDFIGMFDLFARDKQSRQTVFMAIVKGDNPDLIYSAQTGLADTIGDYIESLNRSEPLQLSNSVYTTLLDFMKDYYEDGKEPVISVIEIVKDDTPSENNSSGSNSSSKNGSQERYKLKLDGLAAIKNNKLVGYMNGNEARAYNIVTNNLKGAIASVPFKEKEVVLDIFSSKCDQKVTIKDNQTTIDVSVKMHTALSEMGGYSDTTKPEVIKELEGNFNRLMEEQISESIKKAQTEFKSDIFGFGMAAHYQNTKEWNKIKNNWNDNFSNAKVTVKVESSIDAQGEIKQPFKLET